MPGKSEYYLLTLIAVDLKTLIYDKLCLQSVVTSGFSDSDSRTNYAFTTSNLAPEDIAKYYCQ